MNVRWLWKARPLEKPSDILSRGLFRLLWCGVGGAITILVLTHTHEEAPRVKLVAVLVLAMAGLGVLVDTLRLLVRRNP